MPPPKCNSNVTCNKDQINYISLPREGTVQFAYITEELDQSLHSHILINILKIHRFNYLYFTYSYMYAECQFISMAQEPTFFLKFRV